MLTTRWPESTTHRDDWQHRHRLRRAALQLAWSDFLSRVAWELFVTLTFDPKKVFPVSSQTASREAFWWCGQAGRLLRRPIAWVYAPERGPSGLWHVHALLVGTSGNALPAARALWRARNGRIDVRLVADVQGVTLYTTKQAALTGEIVWADTLQHYARTLQDTPVIGLHS